MGTKIEWAEEVWNPTTGCHKISEGCRHCYAERLSLQYGTSKKPWVAAHAMENVQVHESRLSKPGSIKTGTVFFVNSMSDLFHPLIKDSFIDKVWQVMAQTPRHYYLILTKRPERMREYMLRRNSVLPNVGLGTSVESQMWAMSRLPELIGTPAAMRFVSVEPLISEVDIQPWINRLNWIIAGGESGPGARPCNEDWLRSIRDTCVEAGVPYFLKQLGGHPDKRGGDDALLDGKMWHEVPPVIEKYWTTKDEPVQGRLF